MSSSLAGSTGYGGGGSTGSKMRGLDPRMKHISGHHRFQNFTPEQMELFLQAMEQIGPDSFLSLLANGDEETFNQLEAPALKQFSGLQGGIASRFSGMGMGAGKSSGHINSQNQAASDFAQQLQSNRLGLQRQALGDMQSYTQQLLGQQPYGLQKRNQSPGFAQSLLGSGVLGDVTGQFTQKLFDKYL